MQYDHIRVPENGEAITANTDHTLVVPDFPVLPFIEGDGIGIDVTPVMLDVVNAAVAKAYGDKRAIRWMQVYAGQAAAEDYVKLERLSSDDVKILLDEELTAIDQLIGDNSND